MKDFRSLLVWQKAHQMALRVFQLTEAFPPNKAYFSNQLQRAALSVPTNIAEGSGRGSDGDLRRFLQISMGSASEVEYLLLMAHDLQLIDPSQYQETNKMIVEVKRMLAAFIGKLRTSR
ncbi:MAG: four helix bundle protein [Anaerolineaceae bacterium]|nr:four helix bundle protein [Anaerolineaceae bacterium]